MCRQSAEQFHPLPYFAPFINAASYLLHPIIMLHMVMFSPTYNNAKPPTAANPLSPFRQAPLISLPPVLALSLELYFLLWLLQVLLNHGPKPNCIPIR